MGQRLVIEIKEGDTVLANAYYHWSGYTETSLNLLNEVMNKGIFDNIPIKFSKGDEQLYAIKLLETTGAKILEEDLKIATLKFPMNEFETSKNKKESLEIDFTEDFNTKIPALPAHIEKSPYHSYLCVVNGNILANLYEKYGARPIKRFVQRNVETLIANAIINDKVKFGSTITIDFQDNKLILK